MNIKIGKNIESKLCFYYIILNVINIDSSDFVYLSNLFFALTSLLRDDLNEY